MTKQSYLLRKYDQHGPRYTSYPTAVQFNENFTRQEYYIQALESNDDPIPRSLSLYLHIPFCRSLCYYCGCHKVITHNKSKIQHYINLLKKEISLQARLFDTDRLVEQIHFGGGTPAYIGTDNLLDLMTTISRHFSLANIDEREQGIEIDPRTTTAADIEAMVSMGFNRMSFGIQDFDPEVQTAINRIQPQLKTLQLLEAARKAGVPSISVDLIYGLPKQSEASFKNTLKAITQYRPNRISLYHYAHLPHLIKSQKLINECDLPSSQTKLELLTTSINTLKEAGYIYIGMDHFALPEDPLSQSLRLGTLQRNFQGYSTHKECDIIGMGVSAISRIGSAFSQNEKYLPDYYQKLEKKQIPTSKGYQLSFDDQIRAAVIQSIMCSQSIIYSEFYKQHKVLFQMYFKVEIERLRDFQRDDLLTIDMDGVHILEQGRHFLRNIAMVFDTYLTEQQEEHPLKFSKVL